MNYTTKPMSVILETAAIVRVAFDPADLAHLKSLQHWLKCGNWGDVKFKVESPYITVPETVMRKMCAHAVEQGLTAQCEG